MNAINRLERLLLLAGFALLAGSLLFVLSIGRSSASTSANNTFHETFDGNPVVPQPWEPGSWDVTVHSRGREHLYELTAMHAGHGEYCEPPAATHLISGYEEAVFQCRDHVMTAINDAGYGAIYLTPNQLIDFSGGEAVVRFDVSTLRTSSRDWIDLSITPYADHLQLPLIDWLPDLSGEPRRGVNIRMDVFNGDTIFKASVIRNHQAQDVGGNWWTGYESFLTPSATTRTTFELRISETHLKFGIPAHDFWWIDSDIAALGWNQGVVQFGHHSYTPTKDCSSCSPNTWHWDNVVIDPAVPFTMLRANRRYVDHTTSPSVSFSAPAPSNAYLRFAAIGKNLEISTNGGNSWQAAQPQAQERYDEDKFWSYWMPIPAGTTEVRFRGQNWWGGVWHVRDISIWSRQGAAPRPATATATAQPTTPAATATPLPPTSTPPASVSTLPLQAGVIENVTNTGWKTITLPQSYDSMVVVASVNTAAGRPPLVTRVRNGVGNSFQVQVQRADGSSAAVGGVTVHYLVVEEGVYTAAQHGVTMEAVRLNSTVTDGRGRWKGQLYTYSNQYHSPVVVGQVMTANDARFSVFWASAKKKAQPPTKAQLKFGKHVGEDPDKNRANEVIGLVVIEAGSGVIGPRAYRAGVGTDTVRGIGNKPPYNYTFNGLPNATAAIISSAGMDAAEGGWPVLYGANPLAGTSLQIAIEEDQLRDAERKHATEQVAFLLVE